MFNKKGAFVGEKNFNIIKMHGTAIKIIKMSALSTSSGKMYSRALACCGAF